MFCSKCGTEIDTYDSFCSSCGNMLDKVNHDATEEDNDFSKRILCRDSNCIGVMDEDGLCKVCQRSYEEEDNEQNDSDKESKISRKFPSSQNEEAEKISGNVWFVAIGVIFVIIVVGSMVGKFSNTSKRTPDSLSLEIKEEKINHFNANRLEILANIKSEIDSKKYQNAITRSQKYLEFGDPELINYWREAKASLSEFQKEVLSLVGKKVPYEKWEELGMPETLTGTDNEYWVAYLPVAKISFVSEKKTDKIIYAGFNKNSAKNFIALKNKQAVSNSIALETPLNSATEEKGTPARCKEFILETISGFKQSGYKCRSLLGTVYICDNNALHVEAGCEGSEAWMETFKQDGSDWRRFYK